MESSSKVIHMATVHGMVKTGRYLKDNLGTVDQVEKLFI